MSDTQENTTEQTTPEQPKLSRREKLVQRYNANREKITALQKECDELASEVNAIDSLASVGVGSVIVFKRGKGEAAVDTNGTVIGVREEEDGSKTYKATFGSGFDADVVVLKSKQIVAVQPAAAQAEAA